MDANKMIEAYQYISRHLMRFHILDDQETPELAAALQYIQNDIILQEIKFWREQGE